MTDAIIGPDAASSGVDQVPGADTDTGRRRWPLMLVALASLVIAALIASNIVLWLKLNDTRSELNHSRRVTTAAATVAVNVSDRLDSLESDVSDLQSNTATSDDVDTVQTNVDDLASCVDDYMDVVAQASGGAYRYQHC